MRLPQFLRQMLEPRASDPAMDDRYFQKIGPMSSAGVVVTAETAMRVSTVYRCVALLANSFAQAPFGTYRRLERGREEIPDHRATQIFMERPNPYQTAFAFKQFMMGTLALRGNAYARILGEGDQVELWPLHPDRVTGPELLPAGRLRYKYRRPDGREESYIGGVDIMHVSGLSTDGLTGLALSDAAKDAVGLSAAAEQHGSRLFSQGVRLAGVLKTAGKLDDKARDAISRSFRDNWGGQRGAFGVPVFEQGLEWQDVGMTSEAAQMLETRKFEVSDIARWFGVPPHMVGDVERSTSWGTGIEAQSIQFVQYGLLPWLVLWEQTIGNILISEEDLYGRFNVSGLLRGDSAARHAIYQIGIQIGMYSPNECRELEELNPREGGDVYVTPRSPNEPVPEKAGAPPTTPPPEPEPEPDDTAAMRRSQLTRAYLAAESLAHINAVAMLGEEVRAIIKLAKEHAKDDAAWRAAVASFYGRWPARIVEATRCNIEDGRSYCQSRRDMILEGGMKACEESKEDAVELLVALTMTATVGGRNAAA